MSWQGQYPLIYVVNQCAMCALFVYSYHVYSNVCCLSVGLCMLKQGLVTIPAWPWHDVTSMHIFLPAKQSKFNFSTPTFSGMVQSSVCLPGNTILKNYKRQNYTGNCSL